MSRRQFDHNPEAVTKARDAAGLTKYALAKQLGCARSLITEIEGGTRNANPDLLERIAKVLACPASELEATDEAGGQAAETSDVDVPHLRAGQ